MSTRTLAANHGMMSAMSAMSVMSAARGLPHEYIELQLRLAERFTILGLCDLESAVLRYTNFFRRFGFGSPDTATSNSEWAR
jgi:hypothetical protein